MKVKCSPVKLQLTESLMEFYTGAQESLGRNIEGRKSTYVHLYVYPYCSVHLWYSQIYFGVAMFYELFDEQNTA